MIAPSLAVAQGTIPIRIINTTVLVPVKINNQSLDFLLDTGSEGSSIDPSAAAKLGLAPRGTERIQKNFRDLVVDFTEVDPLTIGNKDFNQVKLAEVSLAPISKALGIVVDGILGTDILEKFTFKISYSKRRLLMGPLTKLGVLGRPTGLRRSGNQFFVSVTLISQPTELVLDTGTNATNLSWETWEHLTRIWTPKQMVEGIARAGNPTSSAVLVCLPIVRLGSVIVQDQAVRAQQRSDAGAFSSEDFGGILGSDILQQFEITFDLKNDKIFLKPDTKYKRDPYRYVTIGIQISRNDQGAVQVMSVWKGSPAAQAGLQPGDLIKAVDEQPTGALTLEQLSRKLHAKEGTAIKLAIERNADSSIIVVHTRSLLCTRDQSSSTDGPSK